MKKLLLSCIMLVIGINVFAQASCAAAKAITANGTINAPAITGTYSNPCLGGTLNDAGTALKSIWYKYTPVSNGEITISSDLPINDGGATYSGDTRLSILSGTCTALTCIDYTDDVDPSDAVQNYLSTITVPVAAGTTYYIQWDNNWSPKKFNFTFEFIAVSCVRPGYVDIYGAGGYTTTSAKLFWDPSIGTPANYDVDWSTDTSASPGTGTIVTVPAGTLAYVEGAISGLPDSSNFRYYVRSNCGSTSQSEFQGPYFGYLAKTLPYSTDFENEITDGFGGDFSVLTTSAASTPASYADGGDGTSLYTFNDTAAASDIWGFSRAISLSAGETVTIKFKTRLWVDNSASPAVVSPMALDLTVGIAPVDTEQTTVISSFVITDDTTFTEQTATWTAIESGVYNFGFHNNSEIGAEQTYLFFDTLEFTSSLSTNNFTSNTFSVSPNPTNDIITVSSQADLINSISIKDLNGRIVKYKTFGKSSLIQMNIAELSSGMYLMNINTEKGIATKKVLKK
ncbi:T9SS type A sorting domain-containing protein [Flavobacterium luteum]|uniref:T9SS type A sorting domain-containing protein n=1 Tax=Flavobacterium luteum TaxID=2026654 RepID=A0A7J5ABN1_9FLAO|nr:T9SS type A sorting domain-containing protein [Flavobacterium luteum]KAB1154966.1 T9SS type A sorting domain-containing protein [Flavobacterium luteum]